MCTLAQATTEVMALGASDDFSQNDIPSVFLEPVQQPPTVAEPPRQAPGRGGAIGFAAVLILGLIAGLIILVLRQSGEQADWVNGRQKLESERAAAINRADRLDEANGRLTADLEEAKAKVQKYDAIEYQLNLIREKTHQIEDLRKAKPSYPHNAYMNLSAVPEWSAPGEKLLKEFVMRLDTERLKLIGFKPAGAEPASPSITSRPPQP
jgi:hypothetical protein